MGQSFGGRLLEIKSVLTLMQQQQLLSLYMQGFHNGPPLLEMPQLPAASWDTDSELDNVIYDHTAQELFSIPFDPSNAMVNLQDNNLWSTSEPQQVILNLVW